MVAIEKVTDDIIEAFEADSITFTVFGVQIESKGSAPKVPCFFFKFFIIKNAFYDIFKL